MRAVYRVRSYTNVKIYVTFRTNYVMVLWFEIIREKCNLLGIYSKVHRNLTLNCSTYNRRFVVV